MESVFILIYEDHIVTCSRIYVRPLVVCQIIDSKNWHLRKI